MEYCGLITKYRIAHNVCIPIPCNIPTLYTAVDGKTLFLPTTSS